MICGQVHRLLRRACTFDRHRGLGKNRPPRLHARHQFPCVGCQIIAVVRRNPIAAQRFNQPLNAAPIQFETRTDDQPFIFHHTAPIEDHNVLFRLKSRDRRFQPMHALRDQRPHGADGFVRIENATTNHRPSGLVVMRIRRIYDCDFQTRFAGFQAGRDGDTGRAPPDNHNIIRSVRLINWRLAAICDPANDALHVIPCLLCRTQDIGQWQLVGLCQRP